MTTTINILAAFDGTGNNANNDDLDGSNNQRGQSRLVFGKRRLIEFLLSPLLRYKDESVRER